MVIKQVSYNRPYKVTAGEYNFCGEKCNSKSKLEKIYTKFRTTKLVQVENDLAIKQVSNIA